MTAPSTAVRPILQVFSVLDRGGAELRTIDVVRAAGMRVRFLATSGHCGALDSTLEQEGHAVHRLRVRGPISVLRLTRLLRREAVSVVHSHLGSASGPVLLAAWAARTPHRIAHVRSDAVGGRSTWLKRAYLAVSAAMVRRFATDIVGVSPSALEGSGLRRGRWRSHAAVLPNGLDAEALRSRAEVGRSRRADPLETLVVASIARAEPSKNRARAIRIWAEVARTRRTTLRLIGSMSADEVEEAERVALLDHVIATGSRIDIVGESDQVAEELGAADVLLVTSMREGLPGVVLESLACGTPVVSTNLPGAEWIAAQVAGVVTVALDAGDEQWMEALTRQLSPRQEISSSFADGPFQIAAAMKGHLRLWRAERATPFPRVLRFFSLMKLHRDESGTYRALTPLMSTEEWEPFLEIFDRVEIYTRVDEIANGNDGYPLDHERITVVPLPFHSGWRSYFRHALEINAVIDKAIVDDQYAYGVWAPNQLVAHVARRARARRAELLIRLIGDPEDVLGAIVAPPFGTAMGRMVRRSTAAAVRKASAVVYVTLRTLQTKYPPAPKAKVLVRTNLKLEPAIFDIEKKDYSGFLEGAPVSVIAVGSQQQNYKGHDLLIDAVAALRDEGRDVNLTLVGQGALHEKLVEQAKRVDVPVSFVPRAGSTLDVARLIATHDILVMPSRTEGMPKVLLEAMSVGVLALGASVGGIVEVLDARFRFEPGDSTGVADRLRSFLDARGQVPAAVTEQGAVFDKIWREHSGADVMRAFLEEWAGRRDA